jgi:hypothetical protein
MRAERASLAKLAAVMAGALIAAPAVAAPAREALVLGNGTYTSLPPLPACLLSAHAVAAALRGLGFDVVETEDTSSGGIDGALTQFADHLTATPGAAAFVYSCGYVATFNDRAFVLPVSVKLARPADVLTQGVLAKSLIDVLVRGGAGPAVVAIDTVPTSDTSVALHLDALSQGSLRDTLGLIATNQAKPPDAPTPLAAALLAALKGPEVQTQPLMQALQQRLGADPAVSIAAQRIPAASGYLAGAPAPPPAPSAAAAAATPPPPPMSAFPADEQMTDAERRSVQIALARLGYYDGRIDGIFGPDSRAAIRRYQHELGAEMTGRLSASQATRLVSGQ